MVRKAPPICARTVVPDVGLLPGDVGVPYGLTLAHLPGPQRWRCCWLIPDGFRFVPSGWTLNHETPLVDPCYGFVLIANPVLRTPIPTPPHLVIGVLDLPQLTLAVVVHYPVILRTLLPTPPLRPRMSPVPRCPRTGTRCAPNTIQLPRLPLPHCGTWTHSYSCWWRTPPVGTA